MASPKQKPSQASFWALDGVLQEKVTANIAGEWEIADQQMRDLLVIGATIEGTFRAVVESRKFTRSGKGSAVLSIISFTPVDAEEELLSRKGAKEAGAGDGEPTEAQRSARARNVTPTPITDNPRRRGTKANKDDELFDGSRDIVADATNPGISDEMREAMNEASAALADAEGDGVPFE